MAKVPLIRALLSAVYLVLIILSIPMAFEGGINCGVSFSFTVFSLYFSLTTLRLFSRRTKYFRWAVVFYYLQYFTIPSLLTFFLSYFKGSQQLDNYPIQIWKQILVNATPVFTILEGFCSLLAIQAVGQTISWLTAYKSDSWLIVSLVASSSIITGALYFLYRIYVLPIAIDVVGASLLGSVLTLTIGLCLYGILSGKGSIIESSLLFAYIVRCIYETFPQLTQSANEAISNIVLNTYLVLDIPIITPQITNTMKTIIPLLAANLPGSIKNMYDFLNLAVRKLPIPVLFNFLYRIAVFFAATKIIPTLYHSALYPSSSPPRTPPLARSRQTSLTSVSSISLSRTNSQNKFAHEEATSSSQTSSSNSSKKFHLARKPPSTIVKLIYAYSPCIIIPVYTHLVLAYNGQLAPQLIIKGFFVLRDQDIVFGVHPLQFWNWVNLATTLILYLLELFGNGSNNRGNTSLTNHWKVD